MNRTRALEGRHRRMLGIGIVLSAAAHAAVFASLRFAAPAIDRQTPRVLSLMPPEAESAIWKDAPRVIETLLLPLAVVEPLNFEAAGDPGAGGAPPPPRAPAPAGGINTAVVPAGVVAFQKLPVQDPFTNGLVTPVSFGDLPEAEFTVATNGEEDDEIPVYVPGSVGQAKRDWAKGSGPGAGPGGDGRGIRIGFGGNGGGHCPMPGKGGRPLPPVWKLAE